MEQQSEHNNQPDQVSVGEALRAARESAGMSLNEVADRLKLSLRQLEAIERDDFGALPGATFVRGFVRNYARFLEIDPTPLMEALDAHFPSAVSEVANFARDEHGAPVQEEERQGNASKWMVVGLVGVVLGATGVWIFGHHKETTPDLTPVVSQQTASEMAMAASAPPVVSSASLSGHAASVVAASTPVVARPAVVKDASAAKAKPVPVAATKPASAPVAEGSAKVSVTVTEPSWVSVVDANGKKLVYSLVQPGAARDVSGTPPFKVRIGNAEKVTLSYNGQNVDLGAHTQGSTANLELK
jgi:cytoskeleton protein RodZ